MKFLHPQNIFPIISLIYRLNEKRFISYHVTVQLTPIYICCNNYKMPNNILYLNKQKKKMCSYCRLQDETANHIFVECKLTIKLWSD